MRRALTVLLPVLALVLTACAVVGGSPNITGTWIMYDGPNEILRLVFDDDDGMLTGHMLTFGSNRERFEGTRSGPNVKIDLVFTEKGTSYMTGRITGTVKGTTEFNGMYLICAGPQNCSPDGLQVTFRKVLR